MKHADDTTKMLICPNCQTANRLTAHVCANCGGPLVVARAHYYLDQADTDIAGGKHDRARINMAKADAEIASLSREQRRLSLLTARAFHLQSLLYFLEGQMPAAREELLLALQNLEGVAGGESLQVRVLNQLGNVALYERTGEAADYYHRSSETAISIGEHSAAAIAMNNIGIIHLNEGKVDDALISFSQALQQAELSGNPQRLAESSRLLAILYAAEGPYHLALEYIGQALNLTTQIADTGSVCRITNAAGRIYLKYGDWEQAEQWLRQSDDTARRTNYQFLQAENAVSLAELMRLKGNYTACLSYALRGYNPQNVAVSERGGAIIQLALYYIDTSVWQAAHKYIQLLEEVCADVPSDSDRLTLARAYAMFHAAQGEWANAEQDFAKMMMFAGRLHEKYIVADLNEEYAKRLLSNPAIKANPAIQTRALDLLAQAATIFDAMEMPLRVAKIEALLKQNQNNEADN